MTSILSSNIALLLRRLLILTLASLLVFYHIFTLYELYLVGGNAAATSYDHIQSVCRVGIVISLLLVVLGVRRALWCMWLCISALIATHYWAHFGNLPVDFTAGRHPLSYLKGFIFPTLITLAFPPSNKRGDADSNA
ncbi:MAG: hypothetical protein LPK11_04120 [Chromatiaceae bacterium]|nr:hypothetical protein [Chromatiaceae bacterium]